MKILGICGTHKRNKKQSASWFLLQEALKAAEEKGAKTQAINLIDFNILPCLGCSSCMAGKPCPQSKKKEDETTKLADKFRWADGIIFSYPVYGLHAPAVLYNFIGGRGKAFLGEEKVWEGREACGESTLMYGKFVGIIVNAGGLGIETALSSFAPALYKAKAIPVACVGVSLFQYQKGHPVLDKSPFKGMLDNADWAIEMARAVAKRMVEAQRSYEELPILRDLLKGMLGIERKLPEVSEITEITWTKEAEEALKKISRLVRPMAKKTIEKHAREKGISEITIDLMLEVKKKTGR
jgi:multimeric flavodoxin WrbA